MTYSGSTFEISLTTQGTYFPDTGARAVSVCLDCSPGHYCPTAGMSAPGPDCTAGFYCTGRAVDGEQHAAPPGYFTSAGSSQPQACAPGTMTSISAQSTCVPCTSGFICPDPATSVPEVCPRGSYCPSGGFASIPCPRGRYSNDTSITIDTDCLSCPPGQYCGTDGLLEPTDDCDAGFVCSDGSYLPNPSESWMTFGQPCPSGHYCLSGSGAGTPCPAGTYHPSTAGTSLASCLQCPAGYFCNTGSAAPSGPCNATFWCKEGQESATPTDSVNGGLCTPGHYCPASPDGILPGTALPIQCPNGTYSGGFGASVCQSCPPSTHCPGLGTITPITCPEGSFCSGGDGTEVGSCPSGTFRATTGASLITDCTPCSAGYYCPGPGDIAATLKCPAGVTCISGCGDGLCSVGLASRQGGLCPPGHYCPEGTAAALACPAGTYTNNTARTVLSDCLPCPPGKYCDGSTPALPGTGDCQEGYYCVLGADTATPTVLSGTPLTGGLICPIGHKCPTASSLATPCQPGTYQALTTMADCDNCPSGRLCNAFSLNTTAPCPLGYYCPEGTPAAVPCPISTIGLTDDLASEDQCTPCPAGQYCASAGLSSPTGPCSAGWYCESSAEDPTPIVPAGNMQCPPGHYCEEGTSSKAVCPHGYLLADTGGESLASCLPCPGGFYCDSLAATTPTGPCDSGYFCIASAGTETPTPVAGICPIGHYCPANSPAAIECPDGQYQDEVGMAECKNCTIGSYCRDGAAAPTDCPLGHYCPEGAAAPTVCPAGNRDVSYYCKILLELCLFLCDMNLFYFLPAYFCLTLLGLTSSGTGLHAESECVNCPAGRFCQVGIDAGPCAAGYLCSSGSSSPTPSNVYDSSLVLLRGLCPKGHYCLAGTSTPMVCVNGTVRADEGGSSADDCVPCPGGYICTDGNPVPAPCPMGMFCPVDGLPENCPVGTYNNETLGSSGAVCLPCPPGTLCATDGIADPNSFPCPPGHFCPLASSAAIPCPTGRLRLLDGAQRADDCPLCPGGYFCGVAELSATPCNTTTYCPEGSSVSLVCPAGYYCPALSSAAIACPPGYYCPYLTSTPYPCKAGTHCPSPSVIEITCAAGTFCPELSSVATPCPSGYYCPLLTPSPLLCPDGSYCPGNQVEPLSCSLGWAPRASLTVSARGAEATACYPCPPGSYQTGSHDHRGPCALCTPGYVCLGETSAAEPTDPVTEKGRICPAGNYCPEGSSEAIKCPAGTIRVLEGAGNITDCLPCIEGSYAASEGSTECLPCGASATSDVGATECTCIGRHRVYLESDGSCLCKPRYEAISTGLSVSDADGTIGCQAIVFDRCGTSSSRDTNGGCILDDDMQCLLICGSQGGELDYLSGTCTCNGHLTPNEVCDAHCRASAPGLVVSVDDNSVVSLKQIDGAAVASVKTGTGSDVAIDDVPQSSDHWHVTCPSAAQSCRLQAYSMLGDDGFKGLYEPTADYWSAILGPADPNLSLRDVRSMNMSSSDFAGRGLIDPVVCLRAGEGLVVAVFDDHYPVYVKDSLLNDNTGSFFAIFNHVFFV